MSKNEKDSRRGNPALPTGQPSRGPMSSGHTNPKNKRALESIASPTDRGVVTAVGADKLDTLTCGFPSTDSRNAVKAGVGKLPDDDEINRGYVPDNFPAPATVNTGRRRQRWGITPGVGDQ